MKTIIIMCALVSITACSSSIPRASTIHSAALDNTIDKSLDKQEVSDKNVVRVGRTHYNFAPFYQYGTSKRVVVIIAPYCKPGYCYNPPGI